VALRPAVVASLLLHVAAAAGLALLPAPRPPVGPGLAASASVEVGVVEQGALPRGAPVTAPVGPADFLTPSPSSPSPRADIDAPDPRAAARGGGGDPEEYTGRRDREELRAQPYNDPRAYRIPRLRTAADRATPEALARVPEPALANQQRRGRARARVDDPALLREALAEAVQGASGDLVARATQPLVEAGAAATEATRHARERDDTSAAQASNERHPEELDLTRPGSAAAAAAAGPSRDAPPSHTGLGGTPQDVPEGHGQAASRALLQDAYFRNLYARVIERVRFPPELAISFEQGEVVVEFSLRPDGTVAEVRVARPSGYKAFDAAVVTAIRAAGPFGPLPRGFAPAGADLHVSAPFLFDNPLIR
jgi:TonB family protein